MVTGDGLRDPAKSDKLLWKETLPLPARLPTPRPRLVDGLRANAQHRRQGPAGVAEDLDPEVRNPIPGTTGGGAAAAHRAAHAGDEPVEREASRGRARGHVHAAPELLDKGTAPQGGCAAHPSELVAAWRGTCAILGNVP